MRKRQTLGARLLRSHFAVAAIGLAMLGLILIFTSFVRKKTRNLARVESPMAEASRVALQGLESSLANLRGWILVRDESFIKGRKSAWDNQIEPSLARLESLTRQPNQPTIKEIKRLLSELKEIQWWIEDVAQTPGNEPARDQFDQEFRSGLTQLFRAIKRMMRQEIQIEEPDRPRHLLGVMADLRGSILRSGGNMRNFLRSGSETDEQAFRQQRRMAERRMRELTANSALLNPEQIAFFQQIKTRFQRYQTLSEEIISARKSPDWNRAHYLLRSEALPSVRVISQKLTAIAEEKSRKVKEEAGQLETMNNTALAMSGLFFLLLAAAAHFASKRGTGKLLKPITNLMTATRKMANGELREDIPVVSDDELGELTESFNQMLSSVNRAESELQLISDRLIHATTAAKIGVWDYEIKTGRLIWSDQMYRILGVSADEFSGAYEAWENVVHPDDIDGEREKLQRAIRGEEDFRTDFRVIWPSDGSIHHIRADAVVLRDDDGNATRMIGTNWDITARKVAEKELREAKIKAEEANQAKSEFLATVSHEIRTPMNGVINMTELTLETDLSAEQKKYLTVVNESAEALLAIIDDILDYSKIEAGKLELDQREFALRDSVGDTLHTLGHQASQKGIELACQIHSDVPDQIVGDPVRLGQIMINLVGNAIKFTHEGEVIVDVRLEDQAGDKATLLFSVKDSGIGIPPDKQRTIFDPFTQAEGSTTREFGGTGLGLAISRRLVKLMEGRMWLESESGAGSTFFFTIPYPLGTEAPKTDDVIPETLDSMPVLVVDNNDATRQILDQMLNHGRMKPVLAASGTEALDFLDSSIGSPDPVKLILLDYMMPGMDGAEVAESIQEKFGEKAPEIVIMSSAGHFSDDTLRRLGISQILTKPVKQADLFDAINRTFGTDSPEKEPPEEAEKIPKPEHFRPMRVLLVEDSAVNQLVAQTLLEERGHCSIIANNGREAVEITEQKNFDAILMDIHMPELDGYEATRAIRAREKEKGHSPVAIIAMTANAMRGDREKCIEAGMDDYLPKPVRSNQLYATLEKYLSSNSSSEPVSETTPSLDIFDAEQFRANFGDESLMIRLTRDYEKESARYLKSAREAIDSGNAAQLKQAAHSLKGLVGNFVSQPADAAARKLNRLAQESRTGKEVTAAMAECEERCQELAEALIDFRESLEAS